MNILFINDFPFPNAGGVGRVTETLAEEFANLGYKVFFLALRKGSQINNKGITQFFSPSNKGFSKENIEFLRNFLTSNSIKIIINQGGAKPEVLKTILKANQGKAKLISVHHGCVIGSQKNYHNIIKENFRNSKLRPLLTNSISLVVLKRLSKFKLGKNYSMAIAESDKFVLLSEGYKEELKYFSPKFDVGKITVIPNPLNFDLKRVDPSQKENRLVFVGRVNYSEKQAHLLVKLWSRLNLDYPDWRFDVVGDGPNLADLIAKSKALNLSNIEFFGFADPRPFLERSKIFCLTSAFEGFPLVLFEAQAYGVVPVAFNVTSGIRDIITNGVNGFLIKPFELEEYEMALRDLMNNKKHLNEMSKKSYKNAERFDKRKITPQWIELFQ